MKKRVLLIGGIATAAVLATGYAFAQSHRPNFGGFGPPFGATMGPGMMHGMGPNRRNFR